MSKQPLDFALGEAGFRRYWLAMTRQSIENVVKIFLIALILTFVWTVFQVAGMLGWL